MYLCNVHTYIRMYVVKTEASRCKHYMRTCCFLHVFNTLQPFQWSPGMTSLLKEHFPDSLPSPASEGECVITARHTYAQTDSTVRTYVRMYNSVHMRSSTDLPFLTPDALLLTLFDSHLQDFILHHCAA